MTMRIVFISFHSPPDYSGAGLATFRLAKRLRSQNVEASIIAALTDRTLARRERIEGVLIHRLPFWKSTLPYISDLTFHLSCMFWLLRHRGSYDIIQHAGLPLWLPVLVAAWLTRTPAFLTMTLWGSDDLATISRRKIIGKLYLWLARRADGIIAISKKLREISLDYVSDPGQIFYLPYSVDPHVFYPAAGDEERCRLRRDLGLPVAGHIVLFSGAVIYRKGVDLLVAAWPYVLQRHPQATLCLAGPLFVGEKTSQRLDNRAFIAEIQQQIDEAGMADSVIFAGEQRQRVPDFLRASDLLALPSRREGLGNAVLEGMASGLPVIICEYPWVPSDFVRSGELGYTVAPSPAALAGAICTILDDPQLAAKMGKAAREEALACYHPDALSQKLLQWYRQHLAEAVSNREGM